MQCSRKKYGHTVGLTLPKADQFSYSRKLPLATCHVYCSACTCNTSKSNKHAQAHKPCAIRALGVVWRGVFCVLLSFPPPKRVFFLFHKAPVRAGKTRKTILIWRRGRNNCCYLFLFRVVACRRIGLYLAQVVSYTTFNHFYSLNYIIGYFYLLVHCWKGGNWVWNALEFNALLFVYLQWTWAGYRPF